MDWIKDEGPSRHGDLYKCQERKGGVIVCGALVRDAEREGHDRNFHRHALPMPDPYCSTCKQPAVLHSIFGMVHVVDGSPVLHSDHPASLGDWSREYDEISAERLAYVMSNP